MLAQSTDPGYFHNIMSKNVSPVACRPFWMIMIICKNYAHDDDAKDAHDDVGSLRWNDGGRVAGVKTREDFYCNTLPSTSLFTPRNALKQNIIIIIIIAFLCLKWPVRTTMIAIWEHQKKKKRTNNCILESWNIYILKIWRVKSSPFSAFCSRKDVGVWSGV